MRRIVGAVAVVFYNAVFLGRRRRRVGIVTMAIRMIMIMAILRI